MALAVCSCVCHRGGVAGPHVMPTLDNPVETVVACSKCRWRHFPPPPFVPPFASPYDPGTDAD